MKTWLTATFLILAPWVTLNLFAQTETKTAVSEKKIIITKRSTDANGDEITETIVKKGKAAENFDAEQYMRENRADNAQIEIKITDESEEKYSVAKGKNYSRNQSWNFNYDNTSDSDERPFLGVEEDSDEDSDRPGLVIEVVRGSAAEKAGLRDNDMILKLNDTPTDQWSDLSNFIEKSKSGDKIRIAYRRNGKDMTTEATLTTRNEVTCTTPKQPRGFLGVSEMNYDDSGAKVSITHNSGAEKAGLVRGDVITKLDDVNIDDYEDLVDYLKYSKPGDQVRIEYERNGKRNVATATLGEPQNLENMIAKGLNNLNNVNINVSQKEACLGVYTDNGREADMAGARIDAFTKESAAKEVKMEENDLILSLNGTRIENSNDLWNEIAKFKAGETVDVEYLRGNRKETVKTTLKACRNSSSLVTIEKKDEKGNVQSRQFKTWSWGEKEKQQMQNQRIIAIRKGEGDGQQVKITPEQLVAPNRNLTLEQFRAYPNPSSGPVTVEFKSAAVATVVSLFDLSGRQLFREELNAFDGTYMQQFDLTDYAKGTILVHIQQGEKIYTEQIVVN